MIGDLNTWWTETGQDQRGGSGDSGLTPKHYALVEIQEDLIGISNMV
jgi:hypothetical protein